MKILIVANKEILLDDWDWLRLCRYKWSIKTVSAHGTRKYVVRNKWNKVTKRSDTIYIHREVMNCPKGMEVHHINGDYKDNRKEMLEMMTSFDHTKKHKNENNNKSSV